jgi:hypothetical protein
MRSGLSVTDPLVSPAFELRHPVSVVLFKDSQKCMNIHGAVESDRIAMVTHLSSAFLDLGFSACVQTVP